MTATSPGPGSPVQGELAGLPERLYGASPSRLNTWLDCPRLYRMAYLDRPRPKARPPRAHTSLGVAVHNALRDFWDVPRDRRTPAVGDELVRRSWVDAGFRDAEQSERWRAASARHVTAYLMGVDPARQPVGVERTVALKTRSLALRGRIDRLDERSTADGAGTELVVVDYKTSRHVPSAEEARTSLALALYAAAAWKMFHRRCVRVELHHVPTGEVVTHEHAPEGLQRKIAEAESIASDLHRADADFTELGAESRLFEPRTSPLCAWCDYRAYCPQGQLMGPEKSSWAALEETT